MVGLYEQKDCNPALVWVQKHGDPDTMLDISVVNRTIGEFCLCMPHVAFGRHVGAPGGFGLLENF